MGCLQATNTGNEQINFQNPNNNPPLQEEKPTPIVVNEQDIKTDNRNVNIKNNFKDISHDAPKSSKGGKMTKKMSKLFFNLPSLT